MPLYEFECEKCHARFDDICQFDDVGKVRCEKCKSKKVKKLFSGCVHVKFGNPKDTSKWDNFGYRAGFNMEKAKQERRDAEAQAKGDDPYKRWDMSKDLNNDKNWGVVK